ncbi:MAG: hypothetical protein IKR21_03055, partial [Oscillospiraceae bacterium]|nr:hypothetical protein [Oscillospiraceae bacterium]
GIVAMAAGTCSNGLPFSLISACSLWCAIRGRRLWDIAMYSSLRAATASANPKAVVLDDSIEDRMVLKKISGGTDGFYRKLTEMDVSESAYLKAAPILFIACVVLAFISSIGKGRPGAFAYAFASMTAMAASFPAALSYSLPFSLAAVTAKKSGGAVAGWGGACDIYEADGALITDDDIFPAGTVRISGVKLFEGVSQELAVRYAASLIITADTGSARAFSELLKSQRLTKAPVRDFACYEGGGIGGTIHNDQVLVGSSAFMNLMSIRVPKGLESRGTVFTAVNGELIAVFVVEFAPANSVKSALVSMQRTKTGMLFAVRDFNVTPYLLEQKFRLSMENVEMISVGDCYKLSADSKPEGADTVAVVCRDGLSPFAEVITKGRMLRLTALICTVFSIAAAAFGVLLMFIMFANNATISVSPMNAFIYMIAVQVVVSVLSRFALRTAK